MKKKLNILALSPHADDVEIAMGGTIAKYVDEGHNVTIVTAILPKENKAGKIDNFMSKNRIKEQKKSAKILGAKVDILDLNPYDFAFNRKYIKIFDKKIMNINQMLFFRAGNMILIKIIKIYQIFFFQYQEKIIFRLICMK